MQTLGLSQHDIDHGEDASRREHSRRAHDPAPDEPRTLLIRYGRDQYIEMRLRTAVLTGLLAVIGGGTFVLKTDAAAPPNVIEQTASRITSLEGRATSVESEVKDVKARIREMQLDQIDQWRWEAMRQDPTRLKYLNRRRQEVEDRK